jgi:uncharacterized protein with PQ loop repeat
MNTTATFFEAFMIFCWGVSWPVAVWKTYKTKNVGGISILFLWFVFFGYVSGICFKVAEYMGEGFLNPVIVLYMLNFLFVGTELILFYRYRRRI